MGGDHGEQILIHLEYLKKGQDEMNQHLRILNGRVGTNEKAIAVLQDRSESARKTSMISGATAGTFVGGVVVAVWQYFGGAK